MFPRVFFLLLSFRLYDLKKNIKDEYGILYKTSNKGEIYV
jgi:hypothetical protein